MIGSACPNAYGFHEDNPDAAPALSPGAALVLEHRTMMERIIDHYDNSFREDKFEEMAKAYYAKKVLGRVFHHSVSDGIALAEGMNTNAFALVEVMSDPVFIAKHPTFCQKVYKKVQELTPADWASNDSIPRPLKALMYRYRSLSDNDHKLFGHSVFWQAFPKLRTKPRVAWSEVTNAGLAQYQNDLIDPEDPEIAQIDEHYSQYLQVRRLNSETPSELPTKMDKAEDHLKRVSLVMEGAYYFGDFKTLLKDHFADEFTRRRMEIYFDKKAPKDLVTWHEMEAIASDLQIDLEPLRRKIERIKYLLTPQVYHSERQLHCERLGEEIEKVTDEEKRAEIERLIHCISDPTQEGIHDYFASKSEASGRLKYFAGQALKILNELFKGSEDFRSVSLKTMSAKRDADIDELADRFIKLLVPLALKEGGYCLNETEQDCQASLPDPSPEDFLRADSTDEFCGGGERLLNDDREVFTTGQPVNDFMVTKIFGAYDPESRSWRRSEFEVSQESYGEKMRQTDIFVRKAPAYEPFNLPRPIFGRVHEYGKLPFATQNALGEVTTRTVYGSSLEYTIESPVNPPVMEDISDEAYSSFRQEFIKTNGSDLEDKLSAVPEEIDMFLQSIADLPPVERVMRIEEYVRRIGHYDMENDKVARKKMKQPVSRQLAVMESRMNELCREDATIPKTKKYAGVCADFATLTILALRRAGFLAGIAGGFVSEGTSFKMKNHHAAAYVVWPDGAKNKIFIVDGTPSSSDPRLMESEVATLRQRNARAKVRKGEIVRKIEEELDVYLGGFSSDEGTAEIRQKSEVPVSDEALKKLLKRVSRYALSEQGLQKLKGQLNLYLYSPIHDCDITDRKDRLVLAQEVRNLSAEAVSGHIDEELSEYVYDLVNGFLRRSLDSGFVKDDKEAKSLLRLIIRNAEQLQPIDRKAISLIAKNFFDKQVNAQR